MAGKIKNPQAPIAGVDSLHSITEVCATFGIGETKAWELIALGQLRAVRLGKRCTRITKSSIDAFAAKGLQK